MRAQLRKNSRRLVQLLLVAVLAEVVYIAVSVYMVEDEASTGAGALAWAARRRVNGWLAAAGGGGSAGASSSFGPGNRGADPNRMLPGLVSGSRVRLPDSDVAYVVEKLREDRALVDGSKPSTQPDARDLVNFYHSWKQDTAVRYVLPCSAQRTLLGRLQRPVDSLDALFPNATTDDSAGEGDSDSDSDSDNKIESREDSLRNTQYPLRTYNYDPRLASAVYYDALLDQAKRQAAAPVTDPQSFYSNYAIPFNWYDWTDSHVLNGFIDLPQDQKPDCSEVVKKYFDAEKVLSYERKFGYKLFEEERTKALGAASFQSASKFAGKLRAARPEDHCDNDPTNVLMPGFRSRSPLNFSRPEIYGLQARATLYTSKAPPNSITFLNRNGSAIQVEVEGDAVLDSDGVPRSLLFNGMLKSYLRRNVASYPAFPEKDIEFDNIAKFKELKQALFAPRRHFSSAASSNTPAPTASAQSSPDGVEEDKSHSNPEMPYLIELKPEDFEFDAKAKISELEALPSRTRHQEMYLESLKVSLNSHPMHLRKYFREASEVSDYIHMGHHFDARFFKGVLDHVEMRARLDAIVRAYLNFVHSNGINSWLSHGTLYGWLYDGMAFPWDGDHDMQMPIVDLNKLAEKFNQTLIVEDPEVGNGRFFLDVTDSILSRVHGNGNNNIDARFIDVDSGLYVDITGLSVSSDGASPRYDSLIKNFTRKYDNKTFYEDPNIVKGVTDLTPLELKKQAEENGTPASKNFLSQLKSYTDNTNRVQHNHGKELPSVRYNLNKHIQVYNCRNNHFSHLLDLSPLRLTFFHGAKAYAPRRIIEGLNNEYRVPSNYSYVEFQGRAFVPEFRLWMDRKTLETMAQSAGAPSRIDLKKLKNMGWTDVSSLFQNAAVHADPTVEKLFGLAWNTFQMTMFHQKELELIYDKDHTLEDKDHALEEFLRNRVFTGAYKDPFQQRLETVVWYNLLDRSSMSYTQLNKDLKRLHLDVSDQMMDLNEQVTKRAFEWSTEAGYQYPPSNFDFNNFGNRFYAIGENSHNQIFDSDPEEVIRPWTTLSE